PGQWAGDCAGLLLRQRIYPIAEGAYHRVAAGVANAWAHKYP
uniref:Part of a rabbit pseudobeta-2-globin n=1 Tax=Oryctolagus cuniculus TaxID=9986 RepID=V9H1B6_RABIT|nr:unnamed protein product [Oryctolagus cuniculus]